MELLQRRLASAPPQAGAGAGQRAASPTVPASSTTWTFQAGPQPLHQVETFWSTHQPDDITY